MAKGTKSKKKPKKAKRVESKLKEATSSDLDEANEDEAVTAKPAAAESAVSTAKPAAKAEAKLEKPEPKPEAKEPAKPVSKRLTREERRAKRKAAAAGEKSESEAVEDAGSGGALLFLGVIFSLLIVAIIVAMVTR